MATPTPAFAGITDLGKLKAYLGSTGTGAVVVTGSDDQLLAQLLAAAHVRIQAGDLAGVVVPLEVTAERHNGGERVLYLHYAPVLEVASIALRYSTTTYGPDDIDVDEDEGTVALLGGAKFPGCRRDLTVTYTAGRDDETVPETIVTALHELVAHWFRLRKGGGAGFMPTGEGGFVAAGGAGYGVPNRVRDILGAQQRLPAIG